MGRERVHHLQIHAQDDADCSHSRTRDSWIDVLWRGRPTQQVGPAWTHQDRESAVWIEQAWNRWIAQCRVAGCRRRRVDARFLFPEWQTYCTLSHLLSASRWSLP